MPITPCTPVLGSTMSVTKFGALANGASALLATSPPDDGRLFVVGQSGQIWIFQNGQLVPDPFIDITNGTMLLAEAPPGERGLLGLAFHPELLVQRLLLRLVHHRERRRRRAVLGQLE